MTLQHMNANQS